MTTMCKSLHLPAVPSRHLHRAVHRAPVRSLPATSKPTVTTTKATTTTIRPCDGVAPPVGMTMSTIMRSVAVERTRDGATLDVRPKLPYSALFSVVGIRESLARFGQLPIRNLTRARGR
jgi:hypothetical protein